MTEYVVSADGTRIAYDRIGRGEHPVVFVAGATQFRGVDEVTPRIAEQLAADTTWFIPDRRGRGESGDTPPYSIDREIDDIAALIAESGGPVTIFGHSSGAILALDAAARGVGVSKLVLYEPPLQKDDGLVPAEDPYLIGLKSLLASGDRGGAVERFMRLTGMPDAAIAGMRQSAAWHGLERIAPTLAYDGEVVADAESENWAEHWSAVTLPTLILVGDASFPFMATAGAKLVEALPNAHRLMLAGQTHSPDPEVVAPVLREFLLD